MQIPFILLSYGDFIDSKKIFSYERDGTHCLPIFTDPIVAILFIQSMRGVLQSIGDDRNLKTQLCSKPKYALDIFTVLKTMAPDLKNVLINPDIPGIPNSPQRPDIKMVTMSIEDIIEELQNQLFADSSDGLSSENAE